MSGINENLIETQNIAIGGVATTLYRLRIRVRAAVELMAYSGGTAVGYLVRGGTPQSYTNTRVKLTVSNPATTYYLNRSSSVPTNFSIELDYFAEIEAYGGATLTLSLERGDHTMYHEDRGGGLVKTSLPQFDGEFVQLDFINTQEVDIQEVRATEGTVRDWLFSGYEENILSNKAEE